ncbi:MAG: CoB--CoM heterodisulfide reductase subunit C [archaeon]|nr:CoB--CoM heterodisulfide reductase subunit C [archaeon]
MKPSNINFNLKYLNEISLDDSLKKVKACIQCGTCTAGCPAGRFSPIRTRDIVRKAQAGVESVLSDKNIWMCSTCFNCYERCPRRIPVTDIILKLRNMAVREGHMLDQLKGVIKNLVEYGHGVPLGGIDSNWSKLRDKLGLEPIPPTVHKYSNELDEVSKLIGLIRFQQRIPYR